jgi:hypothetical protein
VRETLQELLNVEKSGDKFLEESYLEDALFSPDFYVP